VPPIITFFQTSVANGNNMTIGDTVQFAYAYVTAFNAYPTPHVTTRACVTPGSYVLPSNNDPYNPTHVAGIRWEIPRATDARVLGVVLWMYSFAVTAEWRVVTTETHDSAAPGHAIYGVMGAGYGPAGYYPLPPTNGTATSAVGVNNVATGGTGVTQRKVYRSAANTTQLKLLTTLADNTTTTYLDIQADSTLGVNAPTGDTSALQQPAGQVIPGETEIPVASTAPFEVAGGWAIIGNGELVIRYTGQAANALTGIPMTGLGSITAAVAFNSTITAAPMLTGVPIDGPGAITMPLTRGDEMYLVVQVDDTTRQGELAADVGGPGIREEWVQDRRLSIPEARARGQATLAMRPLDQERVRYRCRDLRTAAGTSITVNLPAPTNVTGTYKIQQVTISNFRPHPTQYPTFTVEASSSRFSFEDWLRVMRTKE
jgi:hypothetical protein